MCLPLDLRWGILEKMLPHCVTHCLLIFSLELILILKKTETLNYLLALWNNHEEKENMNYLCIGIRSALISIHLSIPTLLTGGEISAFLGHKLGIESARKQAKGH